ncbi:glycogen synthase [Actinomyces bovis]|uniref:Glycogen synthase n=1 Tax=Actinomyces bovis TaxID=1658 RepID=A0ABY1VR60_9ACTO|nr:glycosyltransferase family 4 protein [Actinomyces bovis]SPT54167.1 glycogen synthase [Actinomyces bovis]VEG53561.1 glycogen synthase [Actinomyces israelii]
MNTPDEEQVDAGAGGQGAQGRRRVLEVSGSAAGGVRAHLGQCARLLSEAGHDVIVEAPAAVLTGLELGAARAEALELGPRPGVGDLLVLARLRRLGQRAEVVHAHGLRAGAAAALALGRKGSGRTRLVVTLHNLPVGGRFTRWIGQCLHRLVCSHADLVLAVSPDLAEQAQAAGCPQVELAVVPAPQRAQLAPGDAGLSTAWPAHTIRLLTVARLAPQKGLDLLLDTAAILAQEVEAGRLPAWCWVVAGEGPGREAAQARIDTEHLAVRLLGRREDAPALMTQADLVVQTSLWEGQPLTIQEALQAEAAVLATDVGGTAHTARGAAALVPAEAAKLAAEVCRLLTTPGTLDGLRARSRQAAQDLPGVAQLQAQLTAALRLS